VLSNYPNVVGDVMTSDPKKLCCWHDEQKEIKFKSILLERDCLISSGTLDIFYFFDLPFFGV
jgi:hypothetical protein